MPPGRWTAWSPRPPAMARACGIYAQRLLDGDAPWMMMRSVYRLIGLAKRYGAEAAEAACARALDVDVINVSKIESMLMNATEKAPAAASPRRPAAAAAGSPGTRPSTPPRPGYGCGSCPAATPPSRPAVRAAARRPAPATGPDLPRSSPQAARNHVACLGAADGKRPHSPIPRFFFISLSFLLPRGKGKKGLCHDRPDIAPAARPGPAARPAHRPAASAGGWPAPLQAAWVRRRAARRHRAWRTPLVLQPGVLTQVAQRQPLRHWCHRRPAGRRARRPVRRRAAGRPAPAAHPGRWPGQRRRCPAGRRRPRQGHRGPGRR